MTPVQYGCFAGVGAPTFSRKNVETIWLAFFDGEEAFNPNWADPDNTYGSRQLAASLALSGELKHVKAMILVDMVGPTNPIYKRENNSTPWLTDILWSTAARLGYGHIFVNDGATIEDDHLSFLKRDVPAADIY
jgi:Zn-dependent M28 family amino/carboxypeptidase